MKWIHMDNELSCNVVLKQLGIYNILNGFWVYFEKMTLLSSMVALFEFCIFVKI